MLQEDNQALSLLQEKIEKSSPLGRLSMRDMVLSIDELTSLVEIVDNIIEINEIFSELKDEEYFLYLMLMQYAQKKLIYGKGGDEEDEAAKKTRMSTWVRDALYGAKAVYETKLEANRDPLTNIWTRRALKSRLAEVAKVIEESEKSRYPKSALFCFIDADDFKSINDTYGHKTGDQILKKLATLMNDTTDVGDFSARIGGDEFALLLLFPKEEKEQVKRRILEIHHQITEQLYVYGYPRGDGGKKREKVSLKISIGVAEVRNGNSSLESIADRADKLLEEAKHNLGKNIVVFEEDDDATT